MRLFLLLCSFIIILSCSSDENVDAPNIVGTWKITQIASEVFSGNDNGDFIDVNANTKIIFLSDNTFSSNHDLCSFLSIVALESNGSFSIEKKEIYPSCGNSSDRKLNYSIENDGSLIVKYPCSDGPCAERYEKID